LSVRSAAKRNGMKCNEMKSNEIKRNEMKGIQLNWGGAGWFSESEIRVPQRQSSNERIIKAHKNSTDDDSVQVELYAHFILSGAKWARTFDYDHNDDDDDDDDGFLGRCRCPKTGT